MEAKWKGHDDWISVAKKSLANFWKDQYKPVGSAAEALNVLQFQNDIDS